MTYGYDEPVAMPIIDLLDDNMMQQYVAGAREQYNKSEQKMDDFMKSYRDFYSPISDDNQTYYDMTLGGLQDLFKQAKDNNIDLLRSPDGRAMVSQYINTRNYGALGTIRSNAERATAYNNMKAKMIASGTYGSDQFQEAVGGFDPTKFKTVRDDGTINQWKLDSPIEYQSLAQFVDPILAGVKDQTMSRDQVISTNTPYDRKMDYSGVSGDMLRRSLHDSIPGLQGSALYKYYRDQAASQVQARKDATGDTSAITQNDIAKQLEDNAYSAGATRYIGVHRKDPNAFAVYDYQDAIGDGNRRDEENFQWRMKQADYAHDFAMQDYKARQLKKQQEELAQMTPASLRDNIQNDADNNRNNAILNSVGSISKSKVAYYKGLLQNTSKTNPKRGLYTKYYKWWIKASQHPYKMGLLGIDKTTGATVATPFMIDKFNESAQYSGPKKGNQLINDNLKYLNTVGTSVTGQAAKEYSNNIISSTAAKFPGATNTGNFSIQHFDTSPIKVGNYSVTQLRGRRYGTNAPTSKFQNALVNNHVAVYSRPSVNLRVVSTPKKTGRGRFNSIQTAFYTGYIKEQDFKRTISSMSGGKVTPDEVTDDAIAQWCKQLNVAPTNIGNAKAYEFMVSHHNSSESSASTSTNQTSIDKDLAGAKEAQTLRVNRQASSLMNRN